MVYYFKETHKLHLLTDFQMPVRDEGGMRNNWVARFWNIAYFYQNENGDLIHHHTYLFLFRNKKEAIKSILDTKITGLVKLLVCHSIDRWHFHWLDFYEVVDLGDGKYKTRKLKKAHARFKGEQLFNDKKEIIPLNFEKFKTEETFGLNTLQAFDKNLEELKKENQQYKKYKGKNKNPSRKYITQDEIKQKKESANRASSEKNKSKNKAGTNHSQRTNRIKKNKIFFILINNFRNYIPLLYFHILLHARIVQKDKKGMKKNMKIE